MCTYISQLYSLEEFERATRLPSICINIHTHIIFVTCALNCMLFARISLEMTLCYFLSTYFFRRRRRRRRTQSSFHFCASSLSMLYNTSSYRCFTTFKLADYLIQKNIYLIEFFAFFHSLRP